MTFPQTLPSQQVVAGAKNWRLFTPLESSGDIYEVDVSGLAFALGPESDMDRVEITYFDESSPVRASTVEISNLKTVSWRLDAFSSKQYGTGQKGRILISPASLVAGAAYTPNGFVAGDGLIITPTQLDLVQFFSEPDVVPGRNGREFFLQAEPGQSANQDWFYFPYYGRRSASLFIKNMGINGSFTASMVGVILNNGGTPPGLSVVNFEIPLVAPTVLTPQATLFAEINTDDDGAFDALLVLISANAFTVPITIKISSSDRE